MTVIHLEERDTIQDFARRVKVSRSQIQRWQRQGLPYEIIAGRVKFVPSVAMQWLEDNGHIEKPQERHMEGKNGSAKG